MYIKLKSALQILAVFGGGMMFLSLASANDGVIFNEVPANNSHYTVGTDWTLPNGRPDHWYRSKRTGYNVLDVSTRADCTSSNGCGSQTLSIGESVCSGFTLGVSFGGTLSGAENGLSGGPTASASYTWTTCNTRSDSRSCPAGENKSVYAYVGVDRWTGNFLFEGKTSNLVSPTGWDVSDYYTGPRKYCQDQRGFIDENNAPQLCGHQRRTSSYRVVSENWPRGRFTDCRVRNIGTGFGSKTVYE